MKLIQVFLAGLLIAFSASQKEKPVGDVSTRLFPGSGGVGNSGFESGGHRGSFGHGSSPFVGSGIPQRPFGGGISSGFGHGGRPAIGGGGGHVPFGGRPTIGGGGSHGSFGGGPTIGGGIHDSFGGRPHIGEVQGGFGERPPIGGGFPDPHSGGSGSNCRYWCNQDHGQVYCCEYDSDPIRAVGEKFGKCPPVRPTCPGTKFGPDPCSNDFSCAGIDKCCFDKCLNIAVCKKPIDYLFPDKGFPSGSGIGVGGHGSGIIGDQHGHESGFGGGVHGSGIGGGIHRPGIGGGFPGSGIGGGIHRPGAGGGFREPGFGGGIHRPGVDGGLQGGIKRPGLASLHGSGISGVPHGSGAGGFHQGSGTGGGFGSGVGTGTGGFGHNIGSFARSKNV